MDIAQLETDACDAKKVLLGETRGNSVFYSLAGDEVAILASLLDSIGSWFSAPSGGNNERMTGLLREVSVTALGLTETLPDARPPVV